MLFVKALPYFYADLSVNQDDNDKIHYFILNGDVMSECVKDKVAIVMGAGSVGPGWGNGKVAAMPYAREGARVLAVDLVQSAGEETQRII